MADHDTRRVLQPRDEPGDELLALVERDRPDGEEDLRARPSLLMNERRMAAGATASTARASLVVGRRR